MSALNLDKWSIFSTFTCLFKRKDTGNREELFSAHFSIKLLIKVFNFSQDGVKLAKLSPGAI